ncbi:DtxR family transcriptional regulator [Tepiditoga spiralis]|uniref:DtxR family transcriptional regulator n=1 Tax=Tepiditoga spiralis TaxID=2108365 RepID=A0A7G1G791_9BACT|nr:metal-dependent transcriptional regulator [Tepiditoga spiralis]BBE32075.1 DtxR family transcriptional regulator [Tepiditoga spiralis]
MKKISESLENYLRAIYILHIDGKIPRIRDISKMLEVRDASAFDAIKRLENMDYVSHEKYGYIDLTEKGLAEAESVYRKYITLIDFFVNILNISKEQSYKLSCGVEHHMTEDFYVSLEAMMIFLKRNPIEYRKLKDFIKKYKKEMPHVFRKTLEELNVGEESEIINISCNNEKKEQIFKLGLFPGINFLVKSKNETSIELEINSKTIRVLLEDAMYVIVK